MLVGLISNLGSNYLFKAMDITGTGATRNQGSQAGNGQSAAMSTSAAQPDLIAQLFQELRAVTGSAPPTTVTRPGGIKDFKSLRPTEFNGSGGPLAAREWMEQMDHMLVAALVPESDKVNVLQIQFSGMARAWYDLLEQTYEGKLAWEDLKKEFDEEYFSTEAQDELVERFEKI